MYIQNNTQNHETELRVRELVPYDKMSSVLQTLIYESTDPSPQASMGVVSNRTERQ